METFDAIVLAGGSSRRLGGADKPLVELDGRPLLAHVVDAVVGAGRIVVVGPTRPGTDGVLWRQEDPPGGGPVAALAAGAESICAATVVVLAADLPFIAPAVPALLRAVAGGDVAVITADGRPNYLASAWRTAVLRARLAALGRLDGASMRALTATTRLVEVPDEDDWSAGCDTWEDIERARERGKGRRG